PAVITRARAAFIFIFVTVLLDMVAFGVIIPVLPQLIVTLEGGDTASAAGVFGIFGTAFAFMQFLSAPFLGALADRFGRRPVILLSNLGLGADYVVMALAPTIPILFVGRLISGITSSSFSTAGAYVADFTPPEKRAARFGMLGVAFGIGFIIGPALAGVSSLIVQGGVISRVVAAVGEYRALLTGLFIGLLGQLLLGLAPTAPLFLAGIPVWSLFGLATPSLQAIASRSVEPTAQGQ